MAVSTARAILELCFVSRQQFKVLHTVDVQPYRYTQNSLSLTTDIHFQCKWPVRLEELTDK